MIGFGVTVKVDRNYMAILHYRQPGAILDLQNISIMCMCMQACAFYMIIFLYSLIFMHPPAHISNKGNMHSPCVVCDSVRQSASAGPTTDNVSPKSPQIQYPGQTPPPG